MNRKIIETIVIIENHKNPCIGVARIMQRYDEMQIDMKHLNLTD